MSRNFIQALRPIIGFETSLLPNLFSRCIPICQHHALLKSDFHDKLWHKTDSNLYVHHINSKHFIRHAHIIHMRGLDWEAKEQDVVDFFKPLNITPSKIGLRCDIAGRTSGLCEVEFATHDEALIAMRKKNAFIGNRFIRLNLKSSADDGLTETAINEMNTPLKKFDGAENQSIEEKACATGHYIRMSNLPTRITEQAIFQFFWPLNVRPTSVQPVYDENGYRSGEFDIEFLTHDDAVRAMSKNNTIIGHRFVELTLYSDVCPVPRPPMHENATGDSKQPSDYERTVA